MTGGCVVILGSVGKNFAAGMSGGVGFIFAEDLEAFQKKCNQQLVDIEPLADHEDISKLKQLLSNHFKYTESSRAAYILKSWEESLPNWVKVIPKEYKRILQINQGNIEEEIPFQQVQK